MDNYLFAADVSIGSNKQIFTILLDTGSEILWVPGQEAVSSSGANIYNPSNSQTSKRSSEKVNYEYSSGKISGYYYTDQINFLVSKTVSSVDDAFTIASVIFCAEGPFPDKASKSCL